METGEHGGAGNLVICEILLMHIREEVLDADGKIDPRLIDTVARLGGDWYCRVNGDALFKVPKPLDKVGIGFDQIPDEIRFSKILTGNDLGMLGNVERLPDMIQIESTKGEDEIAKAIKEGEESLHKLAKAYLEKGNVDMAWKILLQKK